MSNDSTTVRKDQSFEIALTEYRGKVYGYSRSEFIVDDTIYYVVKRVKGTIDGDVCEVTDDEIIAYNFRGKLDKGIKVTSIFRKNQNDSTWYLDGTWKTNATKKYYSVTGKVKLEEEKDLTASKIFPHLEELNLAEDVAFYKEREITPSKVRMMKPEKIKTEYSTKADLAIRNADVTVAISKPDLQRAEARPVPVTSALIVTSVTGTNKPDVSPVATEPIEIKSVEINEEVVTLKKTVIDLPKTDTKNIPATTVAVSPTTKTKTKAENKILDDIAIVSKTTTDVLVKGSADKKEIKAAPVTKTVIIKENPSNKNPSNASSSLTNNKSVKPEPITKSIPGQEQVLARQSENNTTKMQVNANGVIETNKSTASVIPKLKTDSKKQDVGSTNPVVPYSVIINNPVPEKKADPITTISVIREEKKPAVDIIAMASLVAGRKSEFSQIVSFKSDSLELSLYDNGEIDGDTVSVFMNGEVIMSKQGLKASAIKKTIYITPGNEDFTLVLFAENLGKYPPNTGLLVVHDGEDVYNLRFSSDFQKNAGIVFKRKK